jgi:hypothetical protein
MGMKEQKEERIRNSNEGIKEPLNKGIRNQKIRK